MDFTVQLRSDDGSVFISRTSRSKIGLSRLDRDTINFNDEQTLPFSSIRHIYHFLIISFLVHRRDIRRGVPVMPVDGIFDGSERAVFDTAEIPEPERRQGRKRAN